MIILLVASVNGVKKVLRCFTIFGLSVIIDDRVNKKKKKKSMMHHQLKY